MDSWYLPITLLPSIGFFIMSTTNVSNALSAEIAQLMALDTVRDKPILNRKINQLSLLSNTLVLLYGSAIFMAVAGLIAGLNANFMVMAETLVAILLCGGILAVCIALVLLMIYAFRAVNIKRDQFRQP